MTATLQLRHGSRSDPSQTLIKAARLVDEHVGIIRVIYENPCEPDGPAMFGYGSILNDTTQFGLPAAEPINGSTSAVRAQALAGAIGEAVERYSSRIVPDEQLVTASLQDLGDHALDPRNLVLYSDDQYNRTGFPYLPVDEHQMIRWAHGHSLTRNVPVLVPAVAAYFPYAAVPGEYPMMEQTTSGLACGNTMEEAILSALLEVVERHAAMSMWLATVSAPHLDYRAADNALLRRTIRLFDRVRYDIHLMDATGDLGIPVVVSAAVDRSGRGPAITFSSAAATTAAGAAIGALEELGQCYGWLKSLMARQTGKLLQPLDDIGTVEDHVLWAAAPERFELVEFAVGSSRTRTLEDLPNLSTGDVLADIQACVAALASHNYEVIAVDVTSPDIREVGLHVARVLVPGAQPLYFGQGLERISPRVPLPAGPNPLPHPYP